jgi:formylglycine-generating enzyme required for sulfatase activity
LALAAVVACMPPATSAPAGNVVLFIDTDAPVPKLASELRIDLFGTDGTWLASRDVAAASASAWPVSFGVVLPDDASSAQVVVRVRAYPVGKVQDYRGYRYLAQPTGDSTTHVTALPAATDSPRLVEDGVDVTPTTEPEPGLSIDRLLLVPLTAGVVGSIHVTLAGACFGTMADMRDFTALATCTDTEAQLAGVAPEQPFAGGLTATASVQGTFEAPYTGACSGAPRPSTTASDGTPLHDGDVCVTGGSFVFGSHDNAIDDVTDDDPEAVALVPSFYLDRYEVTVGRYRAALAAGLVSTGELYANDGPLQGSQDDPTSCTWSDTPMGREETPVTCITEQGAREFCRFAGGDLPLEVQWEYAATMSGGRPAKTSYPWGDGTDEPPSCSDVVYSRGTIPVADFCTASKGFGPAPVTAADHSGGDWSLGLHLVDLAGNAAELALDTFASRQADCWASAPLLSPSCRPGVGPVFTSRGGAWSFSPDQLVAAERDVVDSGSGSPGLGFRCARPGTGP